MTTTMTRDGLDLDFDRDLAAPRGGGGAAAVRRGFTAHPAARAAAALLGLAALAGAVAAAGPWMLAAWWVPDLALLLGASRDTAPGQLAPRAVPVYNALHLPVGPVALAAAGAALGDATVLGLGLAWVSHVAIDRAAGYGLRARDGWQRG